MLSQERKDEFYDKMLKIIAENSNDDEELYNTLVKVMGMTQEELHEHNIFSLDGFFRKQSAGEQLQARLDSNYRDYMKEWLTWTPRDLIDHCAWIEAITRMKKTAVSGISEEDAEYLLRYNNPLALLSDTWHAQTDMDSAVFDDEIRHMVWEIRDRDLGEDYELAESDRGFEQKM